jgi:hypothetical protein
MIFGISIFVACSLLLLVEGFKSFKLNYQRKKKKKERHRNNNDEQEQSNHSDDNN